VKYKALVTTKARVSNIKTVLVKGEVYEMSDADARPLLDGGYIEAEKSKKKTKVKVEL